MKIKQTSLINQKYDQEVENRESKGGGRGRKGRKKGRSWKKERRKEGRREGVREEGYSLTVLPMKPVGSNNDQTGKMCPLTQ